MGIRKGQNWMGNWGRVGVFANYSPPPLFVYVTGSYLMHVCLFLSLFLFVLGLSSHSRIFHSYVDVTITGEGLRILTYARHSWPLSSEGSFSVPHLLWHGSSVYNYHLRGPVPLTPIAERLAVELSLPLFTISVCRGWDSNTQPPNALTHCATAAVHLMHIWPKNAYLTPNKHAKY